VVTKTDCLASGHSDKSRAMYRIVLFSLAGLVFSFFHSTLALGAAQPATVGQGPDSVALQLHYPAKERAAKAQAAFTVKSRLKVSRVTFRSSTAKQMRGSERPSVMLFTTVVLPRQRSKGSQPPWCSAAPFCSF
jgi:hypothetical protein